MDRESIISALETVLDENSSFYESAVQVATRHPKEFAQASLYRELGKPVRVVLETQDEFLGPEPLLVFGDSGSSSVFDPARISQRLVAKAEETGSAVLAMDWLERVISTRQAKGLCIIALWGITVRNAVSLTQEVDLIPVNQLPESMQKDQLLNYRATKSDHIHLPFEQPETALVYRFTVEPVIAPLQEKSRKRDRWHVEHLSEILLALTSVGPCAPIQYFSWFQFEDDDLEFARFGRETRYAIPEIQPRFPRSYGSFDPEVAKRVVRLYLGLEGNTKRKVQVALARLHQSMVRRQTSDQAVEVSIALESLLSNGGSEITYRVGLRAALLLGEKLTDGLNIRLAIQSVYRIRSRLVHEGSVSETIKVKGVGRRKSKDVVDEAIVICARAIRRILELGEIPDWRKFELIQGLAED